MEENKIQGVNLSPGNCAVVYIRDVDENGSIVVDCHIFADSEFDMATVAAYSFVNRFCSPDDDYDEDFPLCGGASS